MRISTLQMAYIALGIDNGASCADGDVGVAFYKNLSETGELSTYSLNALEFIAEARRSQFLDFLATIVGHLNEKEITALAKKTFPASPESGNVGEELVSAESVGEGSVDEECSQDPTTESSKSEMEVDAFGKIYATSEDSPPQLRSPSSSEASISSSNGMGTDSDFSEEVSGKVFDGHIWRCEECWTALVDWKCPNGHVSECCKTCGWQLDNGPCKRCLGMCGACGRDRVDGECSNCEAGEESEDEDAIAFDNTDGLWRCTDCHWEVEADNETDGNCHCLNDKREAHFIDLSDCLDYEPADSCSSEDDSTDSEPDSGDEGFIDDSEISEHGIAPDAAIETINLAPLYPAYRASDVAKITKAAEMARDKENNTPTASSDDIEIIDAPTANGPSSLASNIIECESMDT